MPEERGGVFCTLPCGGTGLRESLQSADPDRDRADFARGSGSGRCRDFCRGRWEKAQRNSDWYWWKSASDEEAASPLIAVNRWVQCRRWHSGSWRRGRGRGGRWGWGWPRACGRRGWCGSGGVGFVYRKKCFTTRSTGR